MTAPAEDRTLEWTLEEEFRLGGADDGPDTFSSVNHHTVGSDAAGNLYVLDHRSHRVVVFAPDGTHIRSMGSEGEGPGELGFPLSLAVGTEGTSRVFDLGKGGLVSFDREGEILPRVPLAVNTEPGMARAFALTREGYALARSSTMADDRIRIALLAWPAPAGDSTPGAGAGAVPDTTAIVEVTRPRPEMSDFGCMRIRFPPLLAPVIQWDTDGTTIVVSSAASYRIDVYDIDGTHRRSVRRELPLRAATEEHAIAEAGDGLRMRGGAGGCEATAAEVVEERGFADELPAVRNVLSAPSGEIWVERFEPGTPAAGVSGPVDVFDPTGAYLGTLPEGTPFPLLVLPDGRVAYAEKDAFDVERLVIARVERGAEEALIGAR